MDIELRQIVGVSVTPDGPVESPTTVDRVFLNGRQVGVIGRHGGAIFGPLAGVNPLLAKDIVAAIKTKRAEDGEFGPPSEVVTSVPSDSIAELHAAVDAAGGYADDDDDIEEEMEVAL